MSPYTFGSLLPPYVFCICPHLSAESYLWYNHCSSAHPGVFSGTFTSVYKNHCWETFSFSDCTLQDFFLNFILFFLSLFLVQNFTVKLLKEDVWFVQKSPKKKKMTETFSDFSRLVGVGNVLVNRSLTVLLLYSQFTSCSLGLIVCTIFKIINQTLFSSEHFLSLQRVLMSQIKSVGSQKNVYLAVKQSLTSTIWNIWKVKDVGNVVFKI